MCGAPCAFCRGHAAGRCSYPRGHHLEARPHRCSCITCTNIHHRRKAEGRAARRGWSSCGYNWKFLCAINLRVRSRNCVYWTEPMTGYVKQNWSKNSMYPTWGDKNDSQFDEDADFLKVLTFVGSWSTLSPTIMEVENHSKWKETNIGGTCSFSTSMIMGGRLFVSSRPGFQCVFHSEWRLPDFVIW